MEKKESKAVETTAPHPNKIGIKEGIGYMLGDAGNLFVLTYVSSFLKVFYTDVLKIANALDVEVNALFEERRDKEEDEDNNGQVYDL